MSDGYESPYDRGFERRGDRFADSQSYGTAGGLTADIFP